MWALQGRRSLFQTLGGQLRWRRYRPFVVPKKAPRPSKSSPASATAASSESTDSVPTQSTDDSHLFQVGPLQAMRLLHAFNPETSFGKQVPYISLSVGLDIDIRRQSVRGVCQLPHGLKSSSKILVFCSDFDAQEMLDAGADFAGMNELLQRIGKGWTGFDRCIATPAVMPQVMKVAKVLGPRKLMPNPKSGTLVTDLKRAIIEAKSGAQLEYRTLENEPRVEVNVGSLDAPLNANLDNIKFIVRELLKHKSRQSGGAGSGDDNSASRLVTTGGISMIPDMEKLNRLLNEKRSEATALSSGASGKKKGLFIQSASLRVGEGPAVDLDPELILPSSPAYYR